MKQLNVVFLIWLLSSVSFSNDVKHFGDHPKAEAFIKTMVSKHGFDAKELEQLLVQGKYLGGTKKKLKKPPEKQKTFKQYKPLFVEPISIQRGHEFKETYKDALAKAEKEYGVKKEIIAALIGIETRYGRIKGKTRTFDALGTVAFSDNRRHEYFMREFQSLIILARDLGVSPLSLKGSYAGAVGWPQFMPSNYLKLAVDFNNDGNVDILNDPIDAIGSVANFLKHHGWVEGGLVAVRAHVDGKKYTELKTNSLRNSYNLSEVNSYGWKPAVSIGSNDKFYPIRLSGEHGAEFWLGMRNFYVVARYNPSTQYAMTVFALSEAIE